jgi:Rap1a immunity proteins
MAHRSILTHIVLFLLLMSPNIALAATGNSLREYCAGPYHSQKWWMCFGYIGGSLDGFRAQNIKFCIPPTSDPDQIVAVWNKFLENHPEKSHLLAAALIASAISDAFPCGQ